MKVLPLKYLGLLTGVIVLLAAKPAAAKITAAAALETIKRGICANQYWADPDPHRRPSVASVAVRAEGENAYVWIEQPDEMMPASRIATFVSIVSKDGRLAVASSMGFDVDLTRAQPEFQEKLILVFGGEVEHTELREPLRCTVSFEADTPLKLRMLERVERTVIEELSGFNKYAGTNYPDRVKVIIANFDTDYNGTYIFVPQTGEVFTVALNDPQDPLSELMSYTYAFGQIYCEYDAEGIREKIGAIGIEREIQLEK